MEINRKYLRKYLHQIAIDQLEDKYRSQNYKIYKDERFGDYQADLVVRRNNETIVIEVKTGKLTPERRRSIAAIADYVRKLKGHKFIIVVATEPKEKKFQIENIEELLFKYMIDDFPNDLDELSSHSRLNEVTDIDIDQVEIENNNIRIIGDGTVSVVLQMGSQGDQRVGDGFSMNDSFPFEFDLTLQYNEKFELEISEVEKLKIDNSSYYG